MPAQGEKLTLGDVAQITADPRTAAAVRRLADREGADGRLAARALERRGWPRLGRRSRRLSAGWADPRDVALAKRFVDTLDSPIAEETGRIHVQVDGDPDLASAMKTLAKEGSLLGLKVETGNPRRPRRPVAGGDDRRERREGQGGGRRQGRPTAGAGGSTRASSRCRLLRRTASSTPPAFADAMADGLLGRLVEARLVKRGRSTARRRTRTPCRSTTARR